MAIFKQGINSSTSSNSSSPVSKTTTQVISGRVTDVILDPSHPLYDTVGKRIGSIVFEMFPVSPSNKSLSTTAYAFPFNFHLKSFGGFS